MRSILIVEDVAETSRWLAAIAADAFADSTIDCVATVQGALSFLRRLTPDIALVDLGLPDGSGLEVLKELRARTPAAVSVVTTVMGDDASIVAALSMGANGYILKEQAAERIARQLAQISEGVPALSPSVARRIMEHFQRTGPVLNDEADLTMWEREVLGLIGRGLRNVDVARHLSIAETTVASHLKAVYRKLGISSRAEASWHATRMGLLK